MGATQGRRTPGRRQDRQATREAAVEVPYVRRVRQGPQHVGLAVPGLSAGAEIREGDEMSAYQFTERVAGEIIGDSYPEVCAAREGIK